jgi:hypothetical protein
MKKKILISVDDFFLQEVDRIAMHYNEYTGSKPNRSRALKIAIHEFYKEHIDSISTQYSQYVTPFEIAPAYGLDLTSDNLKTLVKDAQLASVQFGIDGLAWQIAALAPYDKYNYTMVNLVNKRNESNCTSNALQLIDFAALNVNPRSSDYEVEGVDLVEYIIDNFYDETTNLVKVYTTDEGTNMSTNQVYAGLVSYKIQRDKQKAFYLFA